MDLTGFIMIGNREDAYKDFIDFEMGFREDCRSILTYGEFCIELKKGYGNSDYVQIARLYEDENGIVWYDNDYVG
jgi:hypothetical protein